MGNGKTTMMKQITDEIYRNGNNVYKLIAPTACLSCDAIDNTKKEYISQHGRDICPYILFCKATKRFKQIGFYYTIKEMQGMFGDGIEYDLLNNV